MRYLILILLNLPVILVALANVLTQYKMNRISKSRFRRQFFLWIVILVVLVASFPVYNLVVNGPLLDSHDLSLLDIVQTTAIVYLFYIANDLRRRLDKSDKTFRDLHQEISIKLSSKNNDKN